MTFPTPMATLKAPRPTEESNLESTTSVSGLRGTAGKHPQTSVDLLVSLVVGLGCVLDEASVLDGNCVANLGGCPAAL
jgi:hypothetical protein